MLTTKQVGPLSPLPVRRFLNTGKRAQRANRQTKSLADRISKFKVIQKRMAANSAFGKKLEVLCLFVEVI